MLSFTIKESDLSKNSANYVYSIDKSNSNYRNITIGFYDYNRVIHVQFKTNSNYFCFKKKHI